MDNTIILTDKDIETLYQQFPVMLSILAPSNCLRNLHSTSSP